MSDSNTLKLQELRAQILGLSRRYAELAFDSPAFVPGQSTIPPSGKVINSDDIAALVDASLDVWLTTGRFNEAFESELASYLGAAHALTTKSGLVCNAPPMAIATQSVGLPLHVNALLPSARVTGVMRSGLCIVLAWLVALQLRSGASTINSPSGSNPCFSARRPGEEIPSSLVTKISGMSVVPMRG